MVTSHGWSTDAIVCSAAAADEEQPDSQPPQQQAEAEDDRSWRNWIRSDDAVTIGVALAVSYGIRVCVLLTNARGIAFGRSCST